MLIEKYYTYIYLDPRKSGDYTYQRGIDEVYCFNYEPFYIGKGSDERLFYHLKCHKSDKNKHKKNIIKKIRKEGLEPIIIKVLQNVTNEEACKEEIRIIDIVGRKDLGLGPLTNKTNGGDGTSGIIIEDLSNQKFGKLIVMRYHSKDVGGKSKWVCKCECGNEKIIVSSSLKDGKTRSCGCLHKNTMKTHGMKTHHLYDVWRSMFRTCKRNKNISICKRWYDIKNFINDVGNRPSKNHILSRINIDADFKSSNCKWMSKKEQSNNKRNNKKINIEGQLKTIQEWSDISGTNYSSIHYRITYGKWSPKEAIFGRK